MRWERFDWDLIWYTYNLKIDWLRDELIWYTYTWIERLIDLNYLRFDWYKRYYLKPEWLNWFEKPILNLLPINLYLKPEPENLIERWNLEIVLMIYLNPDIKNLETWTIDWFWENELIENLEKNHTEERFDFDWFWNDWLIDKPEPETLILIEYLEIWMRERLMIDEWIDWLI